MSHKIKLGITIGDAGGVGPELLIRAFSMPVLKELYTPVVYGSASVINTYRKALRVDKFTCHVIDDASRAQHKKINLIDCAPDIGPIEIGKASSLGGKLAYESLVRGVKDLKEGKIEALVTLPIDKSTIQNKDFAFPGHTEYLESALSAKGSLMLMISESLKVGVVTGHIPLKDVSKHLTDDKIVSKIKILNHSLKVDFNLQKPKIAVLGLNPHAGDNGLLGAEDSAVIAKAIRQVENIGIFAMGPYSADGFFGSGTYKKFDAVLAMYHDQGLLPFKVIAGFEGVNFTAGLPAVRTSPDHGVAYDLAGRNIVDITSFLNAIYAAHDIYLAREENEKLLKGAMVVKPSTQRGRR